MKILHVIPWLAPRYGGPAVLVPQGCAHLRARGCDVEIVTTNADGSGVLDVETGVPIGWAGATATFHKLSSPRRFLTSWAMLWDLWKRAADLDVIHLHCLYRFHSVAVWAVARRRGVPYVLQAHGSLDPWHRAQKRRAKGVYHWLVEDSIIRGASAVICTSTREERSLRNLGYRVPIWVIPIGIEAEALRAPAAAAELLARTGADPDGLIVTFLGRIAKKKGIGLLVEAFRQTAEMFPDAHLIVAGPDDEGIGRNLVPTIVRMGLTERISFVGEVAGSEKRALLQRSNVFVLPSADESFGVAVAEAMAVGCPVVVSPHVALEDIVRESGAGLVVERDPTSIAGAVEAILGDPAAAAAMSEAGRRVVDDRFSWPHIAAQLESVYESVLSSRRGSNRSRA